MELTHQQLLDALHYNPETGIFTWKIRAACRIHVGDVAGGKPYPYVRIRIFNELYAAHRLAWFYVTKYWPVNFIDHKNCIKTDNRFHNLRDATVSENAQNRINPSINNKSGILGVFQSGCKWIASIKINGRNKRIGIFLTKESAYATYVDEKRKSHSHCSL